MQAPERDGQPGRAELYERLRVVEDDSWWLDLARVSPDRRVIEFGAGTGRLTRAFRDTGVHVTAVEHDPVMLDHLRAATHADPQVEVVAADVAVLPEGARAGLVVLPAGLLNELPDAASRRAALRAAARSCTPGATVAIHLLSPWWLARLEGRHQGILSPLDGGPAVEVGVEAGELDVWRARRRATLTYRFADGAVFVDRLDAAVVSPVELREAMHAAGLEIRTVFGARPPSPISADDIAWHVLAGRPPDARDEG